MRKSLGIVLIVASLYSMEKVDSVTVITGTRTTKAIEEAPIKTELVTKKDIERTHAKTLDEAIEYIPGLMIKETHGKEGSGVWIQGINADRVLILINGEPMTASTGTTVDLTQINVGDIENIEIIKGAASALYGSQAIGGVINILTKKPKEGFHNTIKVEAGTFLNKGANNLGLATFRGNQSYKNEKLYYTLDLDYRHESGIKLEEDYTYDLPELDKLNINSELRFLGETQWFIRPKFYTEDTKKPYTSFTPGVGYIKEEKKEKSKKYRLGLGAIHSFCEEDKFKFSLFREKYDDDSIIDKLATSFTDQLREAEMTLTQGEFQYDTSIIQDRVITLGGSFSNEKLIQSNTKTGLHSIDVVHELGSNAKKDNQEFFLQDDYFITDNLELISGVRYQNDKDFGDYIAPKISLFYTPLLNLEERLNVRLSYGNGYKVPNLKERFFFFDHSALGYQVLGNPNLEPESSDSYQFSTEYIKDSGDRYSINFYKNNIKDLIDSIRDDELSSTVGLEIYRYKNINRAFTRGVELEFQTTLNNYFNIQGGYTYLDSQNKKTGKTLTQRPKHQLKAILNFQHKQYDALISLKKESKEFVDEENKVQSPAKTRVDLKVNYKLRSTLSFYGGINNLFDEHRKREKYGQDLRTKRPRYLYIGTNYKF